MVPQSSKNIALCILMLFLPARLWAFFAHRHRMALRRAAVALIFRVRAAGGSGAAPLNVEELLKGKAEDESLAVPC